MLRSGALFLALPLLAPLCPLVPVQAQQPAEAGVITIESDLQSADNNTGVITASGNVRLVHAGRGLVATSRQAQYFTEEDRIVLSGDVDVIQNDGNLLRADRFTYLLEEGRAMATPLPGQQVFSEWSLQPSQPVADADPETSSVTP
ncbi:LptA/OstA family protein [Parasynechococcus sp.]|uniref:LptA/OstA family protein n=1 Tax=Parasynechococcus sp. TaxID=3101203 RepID=UPI003704B5C2